MNKPDHFDTALARLAEITETLEKGESSLDNLVKLFEEGLEISVYCNQMLKRTEGEISQLLETLDGELVLNPYEKS